VWDVINNNLRLRDRDFIGKLEGFIPFVWNLKEIVDDVEYPWNWIGTYYM
jgi:hypothetical protein